MRGLRAGLLVAVVLTVLFGLFFLALVSRSR